MAAVLNMAQNLVSIHQMRQLSSRFWVSKLAHLALNRRFARCSYSNLEFLLKWIHANIVDYMLITASPLAGTTARESFSCFSIKLERTLLKC